MDVSLDIGDCPVYLRVPTSEISNKISSEYRYKKLGLAIGASAAVKRWPARRWAEFCRFASGGEYRLYLIGSGTEEEALAEELGDRMPEVHCLLSGPLGGDAQIGAMIAEGKVDMLVFFCDNLIMQGHQNDVMSLVRLASLYNVPFATNRSTADFIISSPLYKSETYERIIPKAIENYKNRKL